MCAAQVQGAVINSFGNKADDADGDILHRMSALVLLRRFMVNMDPIIKNARICQDLIHEILCS